MKEANLSEKIEALLDEYFNLGVAEGREGRNHDTLNGDAQRVRYAISYNYLERVRAMEAALGWYAEQARLCRLVHSEGDAGRHALAGDGGKRARAALSNREDGDV
jgi:hypothetical protein